MRELEKPQTLVCGRFRLKLGGRPLIMAILNLTPDSFSDGGELLTPQAAYRRALALQAAGADLLDVGAESTRPHAVPVSATEEKRRLLPALKRLTRLSLPISVDTTKPEVAAAALAAGASLINDVTALADPAMRRLAARTRVPVVLMHSRGIPAQVGSTVPASDDIVAEVCASLRQSAKRAQAAGVRHDRILLDPGIGFGKRPEENLLLLRGLRRLKRLGYPVLVGPSRKAFLAAVLGPLTPKQRVWGTAAACALATEHGADILRVHDAGEMRMVANVARAITAGRLPAARGRRA